MPFALRNLLQVHGSSNWLQVHGSSNTAPLLLPQCAESGWLVMNGDLPADLYSEQKVSLS